MPNIVSIHISPNDKTLWPLHTVQMDRAQAQIVANELAKQGILATDPSPKPEPCRPDESDMMSRQLDLYAYIERIADALSTRVAALEQKMDWQSDRISKVSDRITALEALSSVVIGERDPTEPGKTKKKPVDLHKTCVYAGDEGKPEVFIDGDWVPLADCRVINLHKRIKDSGAGRSGDIFTGPGGGRAGDAATKELAISRKAAARDGKIHLTHGCVRNYFDATESPLADSAPTEPGEERSVSPVGGCDVVCRFTGEPPVDQDQPPPPPPPPPKK